MTPTRPTKTLLLQQLREVEINLSPENLTCDGEASVGWIRMEGNRLRKLRAKLVKQLGYEPTTQELFPEFRVDSNG